MIISPPSPPPCESDPYPALGIGIDVGDAEEDGYGVGFGYSWDWNRFTPPSSPEVKSVAAGDARENGIWMLGGLHRPPLGDFVGRWGEGLSDLGRWRASNLEKRISSPPRSMMGG